MNELHPVNSTHYWQQFLELYQINPEYPDDFFALETCKLALQAVMLGNFGIGSIIVAPNHKIVAKGHNQVFHPYFQSDGHGEMVVMRRFEDQYRDISTMRGYTLYTSLESCPMCLTRLITSGCERILHVADDPLGGMVHLQHLLPPIWLQLAKAQTFTKAQCSPELMTTAQSIFMINVMELNDRLQQRLHPTS